VRETLFFIFYFLFLQFFVFHLIQLEMSWIRYEESVRVMYSCAVFVCVLRLWTTVTAHDLWKCSGHTMCRAFIWSSSVNKSEPLVTNYTFNLLITLLRQEEIVVLQVVL
jgi:hypothetical protein